MNHFILNCLRREKGVFWEKDFLSGLLVYFLFCSKPLVFLDFSCQNPSAINWKYKLLAAKSQRFLFGFFFLKSSFLPLHFCILFLMKARNLFQGGETAGRTFLSIPLIISLNTSFCFLMTEVVSSKVSSTARKGCLISAEAFSEGRVLSHLEMETVGGRDGDVFTLKVRKN